MYVHERDDTSEQNVLIIFVMRYVNFRGNSVSCIEITVTNSISIGILLCLSNTVMKIMYDMYNVIERKRRKVSISMISYTLRIS